MRITKYISDCVRRIFGGETGLVTDAEAVGLGLAEGGETRTVLYVRLDEEDASGAMDPSRMSAYLFKFPAAGRLLVRTVHEQVPHGLQDVSGSGLAAPHSGEGPSPEEWWSQVFVRNGEGRLEPAAELDEIRVSETDPRTMEEMVDALRKAVKEWIPNRRAVRFESVLLSSPHPLLTSLPVQYAVQEELSCEVRTAPPVGTWMDWTAKDYHSFFYTPKGLRYAPLHTDPELQVANLFAGGSVTVTLPMTNGFADIRIMDDVTAGDLYDGIPEPDYRVGQLGFKRMSLTASSDGYGCLYLFCRDGNALRLRFNGNQMSILASSSGRPARRKVSLDPAALADVPVNEFRKNRPKTVEELGRLTVEELREEKERLESYLDYDVVITDTNIWMLPGKENPSGGIRMKYGGMLTCLAADQYGRNPSRTGFEVPHEVKDELYCYQLTNGFADDRAWLRNKRLYDSAGATRAELSATARQAMLMLDRLATHQPYPMVSIRPSAQVDAGTAPYADPHLVDRCMELAPSKRVLLVTDDKELRIEVATRTAALRETNPDVRQPTVVGGWDLSNVTCGLSRVDKELSRRSVSAGSIS